MKTINYRKSGRSLKGSITANEDQSYTAVTAITSKTFNSLKNAKDFMSSKGYEITWYER